MIKPPKLNPGDRIAAVTPSWGGPGALPWVYELGKQQIEESLGVQVVEMPNTLRDPQWLYQNPKARAEDIMRAFADRSIKAIFSAIGGDDSVRILPYLDLDIIRNNPKIFLGFSDMTTIHMACYKAGLGTFYGPSIMVELAEIGGIMPYTLESIKRALFSVEPVGKLEASMAGWTNDFPEWPPERHNRERSRHAPTPWKVLQGSGTVSGHLLGGCFEALEFLKGTEYWPSLDQWDGALLFLEAYDAPSTTYCEHWLRNYGSQGILQRIKGILFGRPGGSQNNEQSFARYDSALLKVLRELDLEELPVLSRMDFGHTDPKLILPYGLTAELRCDDASIAIRESAVHA
jgi:muramoyltetrapeptide carboxypeptidase LdcA involved in peptidoglycan recycling